MISREATLAAALLCLRNHYDVGREDLKGRVLERIDLVLERRTPTVDEMKEFRRDFP
jgi:hypothetical protein